MVRPTAEGPGVALPEGSSSTGTTSGDDVDWDTSDISPPVLALDDLSDVDAPAPADQDVLTWDDYLQVWVAQPGGGTLALDDLTDVNAPAPGDGDVLTWDSTPGEWVASAPVTGAAPDADEDGATVVAAPTAFDFRHGLDVTDPADGTARVAVDETELDVIQETLIDAKGDLVAGTADNTAGRLAVGTNGYGLVARSGESTGLKWEAQTGAIIAVFDGGGAEIADNTQLDLRVPFACTLTAWTLLADQSGAIVIDVWKDTLANYPPADADAMPGAGKEPTIAASGTNAEDTSITDWTSDDITAGDCLRFNVDSCTTIERATLVLYYTRT